jgi:hypothetical protein
VVTTAQLLFLGRHRLSQRLNATTHAEVPMPDTTNKYEPLDEVSPAEAMEKLVNTLRDAGRKKEREKPWETERGHGDGTPAL